MEVSGYSNIVYIRKYLVLTYIERFYSTVCFLFSYISWSVSEHISVFKYNQFPSMSEKNCGIYWRNSYYLLTRRKNIKKVATGCKGSFCQCKNENTFKYHYLLRFLLCLIVCIRISTSPPPPLSKTQPPLFCKIPLKYAHSPSPSF